MGFTYRQAIDSWDMSLRLSTLYLLLTLEAGGT